MSWTIKGAAGEPLDATARTLESLQVRDTALRFQSLGEDTLTWTAATADATGGGTIIPRIGQVVELWHGTTRVFRGHAAAPKVGMAEISVTIQGPWWWLDRISLTSILAAPTGPAAERPSYVLPTQDLATSLAALADRAIALGAPMRRAAIAAIYACPKMTLDEQSCASALALLLQWCPDAVAWFDYADTSGDGTPVLHIGRRGDFAAATLTIGTDAVERAEISPRVDLQVSRSELAYVVRDTTTGLPAWATQAHGTDAPGKRQIITVSGPEIADFLPRDDFASQTIRTVAADFFSFATCYAYDAALKTAYETYGSANFSWNNVYPKPYGSRPMAQAPVAGNWFRVAEGAIPEWWAEIPGLQRRTVQVRGWIYHTYTGANGYGNAVASLIQQGRAVGGYSAPDYQWLFWADFSMEVVNAHWPTLTTLYRPWDYDYLTPPAGMAENLQGAQNWVPWEGNITTVADACTGANLLPRRWNLAGAIPEVASMDTLARAVDHDLARGRTTIELGAPARLDFGTLVARIRRDPKDNIVYL